MERIPVDISNVFRLRGIYTAFRREYKSDYYYTGETHDLWELVIVQKGQIRATAGANVHILTAGQAILHEPMEFHRLCSDGGTSPEIIIFTFYADNMPPYSTRIYHDVDTAAAAEIVDLLREAFEIDKQHKYRLTQLKDTHAVQGQIAVKKLEMLMLKILTQAVDNPQPASRSAKNYKTVVRFLEANLDRNLSVKEIAEACQMGEVNLKQTFSRHAGIGVMQYFTRLKINAAITMLKDGANVQEAANRLGFPNQNYFSTVFKKVTGRSPSSYK
jgi:AraC-like DNA-binding protein